MIFDQDRMFGVNIKVSNCSLDPLKTIGSVDKIRIPVDGSNIGFDSITTILTEKFNINDYPNLCVSIQRFDLELSIDVTPTLTLSPSESVSLETKSGKNLDSKWMLKPTFGISHSTNTPLVQCGFSWNGICYGITDNWHTPIELVKVVLGENNTVKLKGFFNHPPLFLEFGLAPEIGHLHKSESLVTVFFDGMNIPSIDRVEILQDRNIIDENSITVKLDMIDCGYVKSQCYEITLHNLKFNEIPEYSVIGVHAGDTKKRDQTTYFNDGINVVLSPSQLLMQYVMSQQLPPTPIIPEQVCIPKQSLQRYDCNFQDVMEQQREIAEKTMKSYIIEIKQ